MFLNKIYLTCKWMHFLYKFYKNYDWIITTAEGMNYLKSKLNGLGIVGIKLGQNLYTHLKKNKYNYILEDFLYSNKFHNIEFTYDIMIEDENNFIDKIESIDENVLGSGSISQTHICYLKADPEIKYVLKIIHPEVLNIDLELNIIKNILSVASKFKKINIDWSYFFNSLKNQIDLNNEGINIEKFYNIYKYYEKIDTPKLIYRSKNFIVMSYCEGIPINKLEKTSDEYKLATNLVGSTIIYTLYEYNIMHGDLHQGNILVKPNGYISLIDFGICINCKETNNSNILYILNSFLYTKTVNSIIKILELFVNETDFKNINFMKFIKYFLEIISSNSYEYNGIDALISTCKYFQININSELLILITQLTLFENYAYSVSHNGLFYIRTLSFMKSDDFYIDEIGDYINEFYQLEFNNEQNENVKLLYP